MDPLRGNTIVSTFRGIDFIDNVELLFENKDPTPISLFD